MCALNSWTSFINAKIKWCACVFYAIQFFINLVFKGFFFQRERVPMTKEWGLTNHICVLFHIVAVVARYLILIFFDHFSQIWPWVFVPFLQSAKLVIPVFFFLLFDVNIRKMNHRSSPIIYSSITNLRCLEEGLKWSESCFFSSLFSLEKCKYWVSHVSVFLFKIPLLLLDGRTSRA